MKIDVFVSYHTETARDVADAVVNKLEQQGLRCWYAPRDAEGRFAGVIKRAIDRCGVFVVLLSKAASESPHVLNEIAIAFERRDAVILPLRITDEELSDDVEYYLHRFHWINAVGKNRASGMDELTRRIMRSLNKSAPAAKIETIQYDDGCVYTGEIVNGKRHGKGKLTWGKDTEWAGDVYEGDWKDDGRTGKGTYRWSDGNVYEGDFVDGKITGKGMKTWNNGDIYEGDWLNDDCSGKGIYRWANGDVYVGDFVDGLMTGYGTYTYANGKVKSGRFKNGKYLGK